MSASDGGPFPVLGYILRDGKPLAVAALPPDPRYLGIERLKPASFGVL